MFCNQLAFPRAQAEVLSLQAAVRQLPRWPAVPTPCRRVSQRRGRSPGPALPGLAELRRPGGDWQSFGNTRTGQPGTRRRKLAGLSISWAQRCSFPFAHRYSAACVLEYLLTSCPSSSGSSLPLSLWLPHKLRPKNGTTLAMSFT